ncbi:HNH endonuclease signature motif containing protein [Corynebacterium sp. L4756]|uniref:HNH endonuclease signature motif containing protein n=1 Tax=unclassified Corynebacterium TaxID=2624378 RepID=UPI00374D6A54
MNIIQAYAFFTSHGVDFLRAIYGRSPYDIAAYGMAVKTARRYTKLADVLFGPADSPRLQREFVERAEKRELSLEFLLMINRHATKLRGRGAAWKMRAELIALDDSFDEVNKYANKRVEELLGPSPKPAGVSISNTREGMRTVTITDTQRKITDLEKSLDALAPPDVPRRKGLLEAVWKHLEGAGTFEPKYRTVIAIGLDDFAKVASGAGEEVTVGLSDGSTMTGAELIDAAFAGALGIDLFAGLFHPTQGPVNLYQARFANFKQRVLAMSENLVCPWPDCATPADRSQVHHLQAHKNGGNTTPSNLTMLCPYHNGVNDDDPGKASAGKPKRGRVRRHRVKVRYTSPGGRTMRNTHDVSQMGAMDLIS